MPLTPVTIAKRLRVNLLAWHDVADVRTTPRSSQGVVYVFVTMLDGTRYSIELRKDAPE